MPPTPEAQPPNRLDAAKLFFTETLAEKAKVTDGKSSAKFQTTLRNMWLALEKMAKIAPQALPMTDFALPDDMAKKYGASILANWGIIPSGTRQDQLVGALQLVAGPLIAKAQETTDFTSAVIGAFKEGIPSTGRAFVNIADKEKPQSVFIWPLSQDVALILENNQLFRLVVNPEIFPKAKMAIAEQVHSKTGEKAARKLWILELFDKISSALRLDRIRITLPFRKKRQMPSEPLSQSITPKPQPQPA